MEKRTLYNEIQAIEALTVVLTSKLRTEVVRGEVMEIALLGKELVSRIKSNFRDYPEVVDVYDAGEEGQGNPQTEKVEETDTLKWKLDYLHTLIHLIDYGFQGKPDPKEKLPERLRSAVTLIDEILKKWDFPDVVKDFPYPDEEEEEYDEGDEYYD